MLTTPAMYEYPESRQMNRILMGDHFYGKSREFNRRVVYKKLIPIAEAELWVREATGHNDGQRVEDYLAAVDLKKGQPYCAAFISWVFQQAGYAAPRTGWSPNLFPTSKLVKAAEPGNVFGIYFPALKRIAHCGLVTGVQGDWVKTIEGNTDGSGGREGDGVYRRLRHKRAIKAYADWKQTSTNQFARSKKKGGRS
ncbi:C40 family peptidase [Pedobacter sp. PWIIR3]